MKTIMTQVLIDVLEQFAENPQSRSVDNDGFCLYNPIDPTLSPGCAIGMYLTPKTAEKLDSLAYKSTFNTAINNIYNSTHKKLLPKWMQKLDVGFLRDLQNLHDMDRFWTNIGLSEEGEEKVLSIINTHDLPIKNFKQYM